jgi:hypothetical protein
MRLADISFQLVASPRSHKMRSFDASSSSERRFGLGCIRFDHVQLLYNAALIFDDMAIRFGEKS